MALFARRREQFRPTSSPQSTNIAPSLSPKCGVEEHRNGENRIFSVFGFRRINKNGMRNNYEMRMQKCAHLEVSLQQSCAGVEVHSRFGNENSLPGCNSLNATFLSARGKRRKESGDCEHRRLHPTEWYHFEREMTPDGKSRKSLYIMKKMDFSCSCTKGLEIVYKGTESHFTLYAHTF